MSGTWEARGISPPRRHGIWLDCMWEFGSDKGVTWCPRGRFLRVPGAAVVYRWHWARQHAHGKPWSSEVILAEDPTAIPAWEATLDCGHSLDVHEPTIGREHPCPHCRHPSPTVSIRRGPGLREVTGRE